MRQPKKAAINQSNVLAVSDQGNKPPVPSEHVSGRAHVHHCAICGQVVATCSSDTCQHDGPQYCSVHVPVAHHTDKKHPYFGTRVEDKPTVRMHVKLAE